MRALVYDAFGGEPRVDEVAVPAVPPTGALIRVVATGLCRSDWHAWRGHDAGVRLPHVGGHEFAGVVAEVGAEVRRVRVGDRVTAPFCCGCGRCVPCREGETQVCDTDYQPGFSGWGSFAELVAVPAADLNVVLIPSAVTLEAAAVLGCRFMTAYAALFVHGRVEPGQWVAVHGCGGVGQSAIMLASAAGARIVAVDVDDRQLERAAALGAEQVLGGGDGDVAARIRALTGGGAHLSLDALGSRETCLNSIRCLRKRGTHLQVGLLLGAAEQSLGNLAMPEVIARELTIRGVHGMAVRHYPRLLELIASRELPLESLIHRRIGLDEAAGALTSMATTSHPGTAVITSFR